MEPGFHLFGFPLFRLLKFDRELFKLRVELSQLLLRLLNLPRSPPLSAVDQGEAPFMEGKSRL